MKPLALFQKAIQFSKFTKTQFCPFRRLGKCLLYFFDQLRDIFRMSDEIENYRDERGTSATIEKSAWESMGTFTN
jgi:hypothetical protein